MENPLCSSCFLGWLPDYIGTISFDDVDIHTVTPAQLQQQMSYIEQNVFLFNTTIQENITLGEDFSEEQRCGHSGQCPCRRLAAMPDGLDTVVGEDGSNLSGGQKRRVAIARALIHNRSILLVDGAPVRWIRKTPTLWKEPADQSRPDTDPHQPPPVGRAPCAVRPCV